MAASISITTRTWGIAPDGSVAQGFTLRNGLLTLELLTFGARVTGLHVPDRNGNESDVVLGFSGLQPYVEDKAFLGCTVGRYANRIAGGRFRLGEHLHMLDQNDGDNTLHGGAGGLWNRNWSAKTRVDGVEFHITSPDGEQGFPGNVEVVARYRLEGWKVLMEYEATTDQETVLNLTNHAYFNLAGEGTPTVLDHVLELYADSFTAINGEAIPLGPQQPVADTPFDFTEPHAVGERILQADMQLTNGRGYDHNFTLRGEGVRPAATVFHPGSGRKLKVSTTEPGVQFYSGNYLDGSMVGKIGSPYPYRSAFCLETQHFPDSPHQPEYPSTVLHPGETFQSRTVWNFEG